MNIISGLAKGKKILVPDSAKPLKGIVCQSIFSTLGELIKNRDCVDLFSGSGFIGLEALSRGAKTCYFIDSDPQAIKIITTNVLNAGFSDTATIEKIDAVKFIENTDKKFNLVFLDPPYQLPITHVLKNIYQIAKKGCLVVFPHNKSFSNSPEIVGFNFVKARDFGKTTISYYTIDK